MILTSLFVLAAIVIQSEAKLFGNKNILCSQVEKLLKNAEKCIDKSDKANCIPKELVPKQAVCKAYSPSAKATLDAALAFSSGVRAIDASRQLEPVKDQGFIDWRVGVSVLSRDILSLCKTSVATNPKTTKVSLYLFRY